MRAADCRLLPPPLGGGHRRAAAWHDYFGNAVNLAARLVAAAVPGQVLAAADVYEQLPDWPATASEPLQLKGFETPVIAYELARAGG